MITRMTLFGILTGLALFTIATNAQAQRSYSQTTVEYRSSWYPVTPYRYQRTVVRTYGYPYGYRSHRYRHWRHRRPHYSPYAIPPYHYSYGYRMPPIYPAYIQTVPPMPTYPVAQSTDPRLIPLSELFLVTKVVKCSEDQDGKEQCDTSVKLREESQERCKPILERITRTRELTRGYQVVASFRKRASGSIEATVRVAPLVYHPELTHRTLMSTADTSYHALGVLLLESDEDVE